MSENPTAIAIWRQHDGQAANGRACVVWRSGHLPMLDGSQLDRRKLASALTAQRTAETAQRTAQNLVTQTARSVRGPPDGRRLKVLQ